MKKFFKLLAFLFIVVGSFVSCKEENGSQLPKDDLISSNLIKSGSANHELLVGSWRCIKFAHTQDGKSISFIDSISNGILTIRNIENEENNAHFSYCNIHRFNCSLTDNLIRLKFKGTMTYAGCTDPKEYFLIRVLDNGYSFVIQDDILIIYFTGINGKNLLFLQKNIKS